MGDCNSKKRQGQRVYKRRSVGMGMRRLLAVFNVCGISGKENLPHYRDAILSLINQNIEPRYSKNYKIAISACCASEWVKMHLAAYFTDYVTFNWIDDVLPLSVTFNDTVDKCVSHFGEFEDYLYIDSGISFWDPEPQRPNAWGAMKTLVEAHKTGDFAITAAFPSNDDGGEWWGIKYQPGVDYVFKHGQTTNMHCQLFSNEWRKAYGRILPDIFASNCMESMWTHMCGAINKKMQITQKVILQHQHSMDGASIGFRDQKPNVYPMSTVHESAGLFFMRNRTMDDIYAEGEEFGFGFEEYKTHWQSNPALWDENGFAKDPRLQPFLKKVLYLTKEEFDYQNIVSMFIPSREV
jgi:hypothetical protein